MLYHHVVCYGRFNVTLIGLLQLRIFIRILITNAQTGNNSMSLKQKE